MTRKVWTAAELEQLEPAEIDRIFRNSIETDLTAVPEEFLARVRADLEAHIAATEGLGHQ